MAITGVCDNSRMKINQTCVAALTWTLKDVLGEELDVLDEPVEFMIGGVDLFAVIEQALQGAHPGSTVNVEIEPEQGFGEYDERRVFIEPRAIFPPKLEEGMTFDGTSLPCGCTMNEPPDALYTVTDVYPEHVVLDGNHPLAGIALRLRIQVMAVRQASAVELESGTAGTGFFKVSPVADWQPGSGALH